jgi:DNA polymerase elongation subunit (family B)
MVTIAGGALRDYFTGETIKDIDVFPKTQENQEYIIEVFKNNKDAKEPPSNKMLKNFSIDGKWVQIILNKFHDTPKELVSKFDYSICCVGYDGINYYNHPNFFEDLLSKRLRSVTFDFPLSSMERLTKYAKKGYYPCNGTLLDLARAINTLDLNDPSQNLLEFYPPDEEGNVIPRFIGVD